MLTRIDLQNFKCFNYLNLELCPLTLLSGVNASGKSSVLQAIALLHQTMREHEWSSRLILNGSAVRLGTASDVISHEHGRRNYSITLYDGDLTWFQWEFEGERDELSMEVSRISVETSDGVELSLDESQPLRYLLLEPSSSHSLVDRLRNATYLTAERLGPREHYMFDDPQHTPIVGSRGEHAVSVLYSGRDLHVLNKLDVLGVPPTRFRQVESRMASFFPGCELDLVQVPRTNTILLAIRTSRSTEFHRPVHTGFGVTQVLPIVTAALSARQDDLLMIENPEVHLHPAGQSAMGEFLVEVSVAGVQVILETHSDHVLNGIRRAVKNNALCSDDVAMHFFRVVREREENSKSQVESLKIDKNGNIDNWPDGFFDQFDKDMNNFAGWN